MKHYEMQSRLPFAENSTEEPLQRFNMNGNKLNEEDRPFHDWYRFVLSFPPHLVQEYISRFDLCADDRLLDPFCGTGTTLIHARLSGIPAVGLEANPFAHFACDVKLSWDIAPDALISDALIIAESAKRDLKRQGVDDDFDFGADTDSLNLKSLNPDLMKLIIKNSISPLPLHKILTLLEKIESFLIHKPHHPHALLALAKTLVFSASNLNFGPEVGVGKVKHDAPVVSTWLNEIRRMADDVESNQTRQFPDCHVHLADARNVDQVLEKNSISGVITSPPYPNEKDYTRTTRLESVVLGFLSNRESLRSLKKTLVRSNTRGVYTGDDDHKWIAEHPEILQLAETIEQRRMALGKTSGFERNYSKVTLQYFGGMARHLKALRNVLRPGARLAYVVGDQASYLRVMIRTGQLLAGIAHQLGYEVVAVDLFRTRLSTTTKEQLREEVLVLKWPGGDDNDIK